MGRPLLTGKPLQLVGDVQKEMQNNTVMKKYLLILLFACLPAFANDISVAFSPNSGAQDLIVKTIRSAKKEIRMAAYSFTCPKVMKELLNAKKRGVDVRIVIDDKGNRSKASKAAMNLVVNAGIPLRTVSKFKIHHDKYIIVDGKTVETGSYNFSKSAAENNSENVMVVWNNPDLAKKYLKHWQSRWLHGKDWKSEY